MAKEEAPFQSIMSHFEVKTIGPKISLSLCGKEIRIAYLFSEFSSNNMHQDVFT
jgi:hypothetical protein